VRVALVSEHASPLVAVNGINAGASTSMSSSLPQDWFASDIRLLSTPGVTIRTLRSG
jgi:hypothetical protein